MRNNAMLGILIAVLFLSALGTFALAGVNFIAQRQLENAQRRTQLIRTTLEAAQGLANDAIRYSRSNPAISAVLTNFSTQARRLQVPTPPPPTEGSSSTNNTPGAEADGADQ